MRAHIACVIDTDVCQRTITTTRKALTISPLDQAGSGTCTDCPAGKHQATEGSIACDNCEAGKFKAAAGVNTECDAGQSAVSSDPVPTVSGGSSDGGGGMSPLPIIGGAVGVVVLIGIAVAWWWCRRQTSNSGVCQCACAEKALVCAESCV